MKPIGWIVTLLVVCGGLTGTAQAAGPATNDGAVPPAMLQELGLSGFQPMSDAQALQVRGKAVSTSGFASIGALSTHGITFVSPHASVTFVLLFSGGAVAGGSSVAVAH